MSNVIYICQSCHRQRLQEQETECSECRNKTTASVPSVGYTYFWEVLLYNPQQVEVDND